MKGATKMKYRESGMPEEELWNTFFQPASWLRKMGVTPSIRTLVDVGCGYGTFLIPATQIIHGTAVGIDIDDQMIERCREKASGFNLTNLELIGGEVSDVKTASSLQGYQGTVDYVALFNMLHCEEPMELLAFAYRQLEENGRLGVMHWKYEDTPRGPSMEIRPKPESILDWAQRSGFTLQGKVDLKPFHYGFIFEKS